MAAPGQQAARELPGGAWVAPSRASLNAGRVKLQGELGQYPCILGHACGPLQGLGGTDERRDQPLASYQPDKAHHEDGKGGEVFEGGVLHSPPVDVDCRALGDTQDTRANPHVNGGVGSKQPQS